MTVQMTRAHFLSSSAAALLALTPAVARAAAALPDPPEALMKKMMEATKARSYDDFIIECDDQMRAALTKQMFEGVSAQLAPRLGGGYKTTYLGKLRQAGYITYLWKLEFTDGKDELLAKMSIKAGKVSGFRLA